MLNGIVIHGLCTTQILNIQDNNDFKKNLSKCNKIPHAHDSCRRWLENYLIPNQQFE